MANEFAHLKHYLDTHPAHPIVEFDKANDKWLPFDLTVSNTELSQEMLEDTEQFSAWVNAKLHAANCRYGIGGYDEHRTIYSRSNLFDAEEEPRRLHLGIDIWGKAGTKIFSPYDAIVHSFNFNDNFGDYGATIILQHNFDGLLLHTLYGHLSLWSLEGLHAGKRIPKGEPFAEFGLPADNGHWPPHLHLQLILDMGGRIGDYPGVCAFSEREAWLANSPDPAVVLQYTF